MLFFVLVCIMSFLVLQSSSQVRESWLLLMSSVRLVAVGVLWVFLAVSWVGLRFVIVVFHNQILLFVYLAF